MNTNRQRTSTAREGLGVNPPVCITSGSGQDPRFAQHGTENALPAARAEIFPVFIEQQHAINIHYSAVFHNKAKYLLRLHRVIPAWNAPQQKQ